jgi:predicted nucleotidyltransferase component of viral defense system
VTQSEEVVRARLHDVAKSLNLTTPQAQLLLCQERFLARLSSLGGDGCAFVWKGGSLILRLYRSLPIPRYTVDIDLLLKGRPMGDVRGILERAMALNLDDGFNFRSITSEPMERDTPNGGDRFETGWMFYSKPGSQSLKIDVCAGDVVNERRVSTRDLFVMQDGDRDLALNVYPPEYIFAEKLETAARFKTGNSRFKDYVDLWSLIRLGLDSELTRLAVLACFANRNTPCSTVSIRTIITDADFVALMERVRDRSFSRLGLPSVPIMFGDILRFIDSLGLPA